MTKYELERCFKQLGLSQTQVAELLGVAPRTVRRWLSDEEIPSPVAHLLKAWVFLKRNNLPWGPYSVPVVEDDIEAIARLRVQAMNVEGMVAKVQFRGGARLPWKVDLQECTATLGDMRVTFWQLEGGGFSLTAYSRTDQTPDAARDKEFIEDAAWCIAQALKEQPSG